MWRKVTDSTLIDECTDDVVIDNTTVRPSSGICFERARSRKYISISTNNNCQRKREREREVTYDINQSGHCCYQLIFFVSTDTRVMMEYNR